MRSCIYGVIIAMVLCIPAFGYDWSTNPGSGDPNDPYQLSTPEQLMSIGSDLRLLTKHYILTNDIIFDPNNNPSHVFTEALIAPDPDYSKTPFFSGYFNGGGYRIVNLKITGSAPNVGLFGNLIGTDANQVLVRNLTFVNPQVGGVHNSGALAGRTETCRIENCHVIGGLIRYPGGDWMGGLVGSNDYAVLSDCFSSATVDGNKGVGGLVGANNSSAIIHCSTGGAVTGSGDFVGGLVGYVRRGSEPELNEREEIVHCYAIGDVHTDGSRCGGLIGFIKAGQVQNCYAGGTVTGGSEVGGLIGYIEKEAVDQTPTYSGPTTLNGCYATGDVDGQSDYVGGLIGRNQAILVRDCYALGNAASSGGSHVGGLIGDCYSFYKVVRCFSKGTATGTDSVGGLIGSDGDTYLCYWDEDTSGTAFSSGGTPKSHSEMFAASTYRGWGDTVWVLQAGLDYPHLAWEGTAGDFIADVRSYAGSGSAADPYQIGTAAELLAFGRYIQDWDKQVELAADIVLDPANLNDPNVLYANANFNKLGLYGLPFSGHFNGQFHSISNLRSRDDKGSNALFGFIRGDGPEDTVVENLRLLSPVFKGDYAVGSIAGWLEDARLVRCGVEDFSILDDNQGISNSNHHGGLVGYAENSTVAMCYADNGNLDLGSRMFGYGQGGLIGTANDSTVENSYAAAVFHSAGGWDGGFVGEAEGSHFYHCYAAPSATEYLSLKGFAGYSTASYYDRCFYRYGTGISYSVGSYLYDSSMKQQSSFTGWDFVGESANGENEIWRMCVDGVDYPRLSWEFARGGDFACGDGVDLADLQALALHWLTAAELTPTTFNYACDATGDEQIDIDDFGVLSQYWGD